MTASAKAFGSLRFSSIPILVSGSSVEMILEEKSEPDVGEQWQAGRFRDS